MADKTGRTVEDLREQVEQVQEIQSTTLDVLKKMRDETARLMPAAAVLDRAKPVERTRLTTHDEQLRYDDMVDKDFVEWDAKTGKPVSTKQLFHVDQVRPEWQSSNSEEYVAKFHVSKFEWERKPADKDLYRRVIDNFVIDARKFCAQYRAALISALDDPEKQNA